MGVRLFFLICAILVQYASTVSPFGQLLMTYYTGIGFETLKPSGVNALALAFFDPTPLTAASCNFADLNTPCIRPATGSGDQKNLKWAVDIINGAKSLKDNTSPSRGKKPTVFFSFGGLSQGGRCWDDIFNNADSTQRFAKNAAQLVTTVYRSVGEEVYIGFDLDVEETQSNLPQLELFVKVFRSIAPYSVFPLQICTLSGLASETNPDHFKVEIMKRLGPSAKGINFLNMMVNNVDSSCEEMSKYWKNPALDFLPAENKILGVWGQTIPSYVLHNPGCTDGSSLFSWIKQNGVGIGIWQWWVGETKEVTSVIQSIRT
ncbi:hutU [Acrasis kona]|uniref:HutU n=1 Tax=Acrasis kona TaxID=1008807 RepID=A0AAW2ZD58_9EUKA